MRRPIWPGQRRPQPGREGVTLSNGGVLKRGAEFLRGPAVTEVDSHAPSDAPREVRIPAADLFSFAPADDVPVDRVYAVTGPGVRRGNRLREVREAAGLDRLKLAELSYVPAALIGRIEDRGYVPAEATKEALAAVLSVDAAALFDGRLLDAAETPRQDREL